MVDKSVEIGQDRGDRFYNRGEEIVKDATLGAILALRTLPIDDAENFAVSYRDMTLYSSTSRKPLLLDEQNNPAFS